MRKLLSELFLGVRSETKIPRTGVDRSSSKDGSSLGMDVCMFVLHLVSHFSTYTYMFCAIHVSSSSYRLSRELRHGYHVPIFVLIYR